MTHCCRNIMTQRHYILFVYWDKLPNRHQLIPTKDNTMAALD